MINSYYTGSNTSPEEWKINLSFSGLCKSLDGETGKGCEISLKKKSISLLINQATVIYWALIHLFVTVISSIASGCDKWSRFFFGKETSILAVVLAVWTFQMPAYLLPWQVKAYRLLWSAVLKISDSHNIRSPKCSAHRHQLWILPKWNQEAKAEASLISRMYETY